MIRKTITVRTGVRPDFADITGMLQREVHDSKTENGVLVLFCRHNGALLAINEAQAEIYKDAFEAFEKFAPIDGNYHHHRTWGGERNGAAHVLSWLGNKNLVLLIGGGKILLGPFQRIILLDYDGPQTRTIEVAIVEN